MDAELKAKWLAALRSGEFKQARDTLMDLNYETEECSYCCLGVLLEISKRGKWRGTAYAVPDDEGGEYWCDGDLGKYRRVLGIDDRHHAELIGMNDDQRRSFAEIADYIEAHIT